MRIEVILFPIHIWILALIFILGRTNVTLKETPEDSFCAELTEKSQHGMAFRVLATVNGVGDFLSNIVVSAL